MPQVVPGVFAPKALALPPAAVAVESPPSELVLEEDILVEGAAWLLDEGEEVASGVVD